MFFRLRFRIREQARYGRQAHTSEKDSKKMFDIVMSFPGVRII
jgi:hypothetical protein